MPQTTLPIGVLADRTGMAVSAIRYYEAQGLIVAERNAGGQRRFLRSDIRRLSFIQIMQQFGFTLSEIRQTLASLPQGRTPTAADWAALSGGLRDRLSARIDTLTRLRDALDGCIGCGCLSLSACALHNPQDRAGDKGPGPRFLLGDRPMDERSQ